MTRAGTRVEAIVELVAERLAKGAYKEGERLPSVRRAAQDHGISKNTMAEAYDRLVAQGLLEARPGSGFYVSRLELPRTSAPIRGGPHRSIRRPTTIADASTIPKKIA